MSQNSDVEAIMDEAPDMNGEDMSPDPSDVMREDTRVSRKTSKLQLEH